MKRDGTGQPYIFESLVGGSVEIGWGLGYAGLSGKGNFPVVR
jgi:hypothetical protein